MNRLLDEADELSIARKALSQRCNDAEMLKRYRMAMSSAYHDARSNCIVIPVDVIYLNKLEGEGWFYSRYGE